MTRVEVSLPLPIGLMPSGSIIMEKLREIMSGKRIPMGKRRSITLVVLFSATTFRSGNAELWINNLFVCFRDCKAFLIMSLKVFFLGF